MLLTHLFGHVKWFVDTPTVATPSLTTPELLIVIACVLGGLGVFYGLGRFLEAQGWYKRLVKRCSAYHEWAELVARLVLGFVLIEASRTICLFAPNIYPTQDYTWYRGALLITGALLIAGLATRTAAAIGGLLFLLAGLWVPAGELLEHFEVLGLAAYVLLEGGGTMSLNHLLGQTKSRLKAYQAYALPFFRVGVGVSFITLALSEKLLNIDLGLSFLANHHWNFMSVAGVSDRCFVLFAGTMELILGAALILNFASRVVILMIAGMLVLTAAILGVTEVAGHLFGIALVLAIWLDKTPAKK